MSTIIGFFFLFISILCSFNFIPSSIKPIYGFILFIEWTSLFTGSFYWLWCYCLFHPTLLSGINLQLNGHLPIKVVILSFFWPIQIPLIFVYLLTSSSIFIFLWQKIAGLIISIFFCLGIYFYSFGNLTSVWIKLNHSFLKKENEYNFHNEIHSSSLLSNNQNIPDE